MIKFSLFLPTRKRIELLRACLESIKRTTAHPENVEILIMCDDDDGDTQSIWAEFEETYKDFSIKFFWEERTDHLVDKINKLARKTKGKYLIYLNDDSEFATDGWDEIVEDEIEFMLQESPHRILYVSFGCDDTNKGSFPCLTREAYEALGDYYNRGYHSWGCDIELRLVFSHERVGKVDWHIPRVKILHNSYHSNRRGRDQLNDEVWHMSQLDDNKVVDQIALMHERIERVRKAVGIDD